jgi:hypothetical protein
MCIDVAGRDLFQRTIRTFFFDDPDDEPLQDILLRACDSDPAFQKAPPAHYEQDSPGLWWWQGRVVVPKREFVTSMPMDATLCIT